MSEIKNLHKLNDEIISLECKYETALKLLHKTRIELVSVLNAVGKNNIDVIQEMFITSDDKEQWNEYEKKMHSFKEMEHYVETVAEKTELAYNI
jgi:hypothetical protein